MKLRIVILIGLAVLFRNADAQIISNFSVDADGWISADQNGTPPQTTIYNSTGGNPGGYISMTTANPQPMYWYSPAKFRGNRAYTSYGETLTFDVMTAAATSGHGPSGDVMLSNGSISIHTNVTTLPSGPGTWTPISIRLDETNLWKVNDITGATATRQDITNVLTNLQTIRIYVSWKAFPSANTLGSIDNVVLNVHSSFPVAPVITALSSTKAAPGSGLTITGTNFGTNNAVYFGNRRATVVSQNSTSIVTTVPVGADYGQITVINLINGLSAMSQQFFNPTFASGGGAGIVRSSFSDDVVFNRNSFWLAHGDVNGDGKPEMIVSRLSNFSIYENISTPGPITTASFAPRVDMSPSLPDGFTEIGMKDLDGDGKQDLFVAIRDNPDAGRVIVLRNIHVSGPVSSGSFATAQEFTFPPYTLSAVTAADLDGDGRPDFITWGSSCASNPVYIQQNLSSPGDIRFSGVLLSLDGANSCGARYSVADLDLDGKPDIIQSTGSGMRIFRNTSTPGAFSFETGVDITGGGNIAAVGDIDSDGRPDIVCSSGGMRVFKNISTPGSLSVASFQAPVIIAGGSSGADIADMNGDGKPDIVVGTPSDMGVYENITPNGQINTSSFRPIVYIETDAGASDLDIFDIDGDGRPDIVSNNGGNGNLSVNQNIISLPPTITNINPKVAAAESTITITGTNFSAVAADHTIYFGGAKGTVTNATTTSLQVTVPKGATYDQVSVAVRGFTVFSQQFFTPTFSGGNPFETNSFAAKFDLTIAQISDGLSSMDFDGDGKIDIIADNNTGGSVFRNTGADGVIDATTFATPYSVGFQMQALKASDFDGDGRHDLNSQGYIARNVSNAALPNPIAFDTQVIRDNALGVLHSAYSRDLNNDGKVDVIFTTGSANIVYDENQTGVGSFIAGNSGVMASMSSQNFVAKAAANGYCVSADFDGDGFNDIASTNPTTNNITLFLNAGQTGALTASSLVGRGPFATGNTPQGIATLDYDGDGKIDLAVANSVNSALATVSIFRNTSTPGNISFDRLDFPAAAGATEIVASDMDGDGKPDLVVANVNANSFSIFRNTSTSGILNANSFAGKIDYPVGSSPRGLNVGDIDRDLRPDVIITRLTNVISIFKNLMPLGPSISFTQQPVSKNGCEGNITTFSATATGANNLTYQWQLFNGTIFQDIAANAMYTGVTTPTLTLASTTAVMTESIYRVRVNGDGASEKTSDQATLTVFASPAAPTTNGASECKGASLTLSASGGTDGNYRWYISPTAPQFINEEYNSTFITPVVFSTTTFYAAIINANGCVSARTPAIATITPLAKPSINASKSGFCQAGEEITLTAPAGSAGYVWSNGATTQSITITQAGTYAVKLTNGAGCESESSDNLVISSGGQKPVISAGANVLVATPAKTYQWYFAEGKIPSPEGTKQFLPYNPFQYGVFRVEVTDFADCLASSDPFVNLVTGIGETASTDVYPNPFDKVLVLGIAGFPERRMAGYEAVLFDATGKQIKSLVKGDNDVSSLAQGMYFVRIKNGSDLKIIKVLK